MSDVVYEDMENWLSRVMPQVISCPREIALDALQQICVDFFKETKIWTVKITETLPANTTSFDLADVIDKGMELVDVKNVRINNVSCTAGDFVVEDKMIYFHNISNAQSSLTIDLILRPGRYCILVPAKIMEEYGDTIVYGTLAKLKSMSGQGDTIQWSDPETAKMLFELYVDGLNRAKMRAFVLDGYRIVKPTWR